MTTPPRADADAVVRHALHAVAAALPVEPRELPTEASPQLTVVEDGPGGGGAPVRLARRRGVLAVAAALAVLAAGVWATGRTDAPDVPDGTSATAPPVDVPEGYPRAGWLPEGIATAPSQTIASPGTAAPAVGVVASGPADEDVVVGLTVSDGGRAAAGSVAPFLGALVGSEGGVITAQLDDGRGVAVVARAGASPADEIIRTSSEEPVGFTVHPPDGWDAVGTAFDWLPLVGRARCTAYGEGGPRSVEIHAVAGLLLDAELLGVLLDSERRVEVGGVPAWVVEPDGGGPTVVLWQASPDVVGVVIGTGLDREEAIAVAEGAVLPDVVTPGAGGS